MQLTRKQRVWALSVLALGGLWALLALLAEDFAFTISVGVGMIHTVGFVAAFTRLLERRLFLIGGLVTSVFGTFLTAGLLLYLACGVPRINELNSSLCDGGHLDVDYVILATGLGVIGSMTFLFAWLAGKREIT